MAHKIDYKTKMALGYDQATDFYDKFIMNTSDYRHDWLTQDVTFPENPTVLDIGCGTGLTTFEVMKVCDGKGTFYGIDISSKMITRAHENARQRGVTNYTFIVGDAETLDYPDNQFDVVFSNSVFHRFPNKVSALNEMYRVLKPGGRVALRFNGGDFLTEFFKIAIQLEERYPEFTMTPSWRDTRAQHSLTLEDVYDLFDHTQFHINRIYSTKEIGYYHVTKEMVLKNAAWQFWQIGFSAEIVDRFAQQMAEELQKTSTEKGVKITTEAIVAHGTKPK